MTHDRDTGDLAASARLQAELRAEAAQHEPDRAAMLARFEAGQRPRSRHRVNKPSRRLQPILSLAAVTCGVAMIAGGIGAMSGRDTASRVGDTRAADPALTPAPIYDSESPPPYQTPSGTSAPSSSPTDSQPSGSQPSASQTPGSQPSAAQPPASPSAAPPAKPSTSPSSVPPVGNFLWADGSVDPHSTIYWAQSNITLKNRLTVTALDVRLRIALTPGVATTGSWHTLQKGNVITTVTREGGYLVYEWRLKSGKTMSPGTYVFAGQYNHAQGGRDAGRDNYDATATARKTPKRVSGDFY